MAKDTKNSEREKKGGFLKSLIFKDEENIENKKTPVKDAITTPVVTIPQVLPETMVPIMTETGSVSMQFVQQPIQGQVNQELLQKVCAVLEEANLPGPDYLELKQATEALTMIPDLNTRFIAAYMSLKTQSPDLDKTRVINSLDSYIRIMEDEKAEGLGEVAKIRKVQVEDKISEIERLNTEITERMQMISDLRTEVAANTVTCNKNEADFNVTVDSVINKLRTDRELLNLIITE